MKGRLTILGVNSTNLVTLSNKKGFEYLKRVLAQKENGSLMYDPMNQKASAALFSAKTVEGLRLMKDDVGASMVQIISEGIIGAMDTGGVSADTRVHALIKLKEVIEVKSSSVLERLRRPAKEDITNELYQMTLVTIDSHLFTFINMKFFHPRRKSTSTVEQFFGQITMLSDGGSKLNCSQFREIMKRVMVTNATRLVPSHVKGFKFLGKLGAHMQSYAATTEDEGDDDESMTRYPSLKANSIVIHVENSPFDVCTSKRKAVHGTISSGKEKDVEGDDINPRKYVKKF